MTVSLLHACVLGIVQGLTEFLPVSSSAHLILIPRFFHWPDSGLAFDVALHLGTLAAVLTYFGRDLWALWTERNYKLAGFLIGGTIPGAVAGLLLEHRVETGFRSPLLIACTLIGMGLMLALAERQGAGDKKLTDLTWPTALAIGMAQSLALLPGVSRSGITIAAGLFIGFSRPDAARFSFLLSIPIIAGAGMLKAPEILKSPDQASLLVGFLGAALSGFAAIWILMRFVQTKRYTPFVIYRLALGILILMNLRNF